MEAELISVLLVDDDPGDVLLVQEAFDEHKVGNILAVVNDGVQAIEYVRGEGEYRDAPYPDLILLDLNLPRKSGIEVLAEIKGDTALRSIPVVVLTTSEAEEDVVKAYSLNVNAYITKPVDFARFTSIVHQIDEFFIGLVKLPPRPRVASRAEDAAGGIFPLLRGRRSAGRQLLAAAGGDGEPVELQARGAFAGFRDDVQHGPPADLRTFVAFHRDGRVLAPDRRDLGRADPKARVLVPLVDALPQERERVGRGAEAGVDGDGEAHAASLSAAAVALSRRTSPRSSPRTSRRSACA